MKGQTFFCQVRKAEMFNLGPKPPAQFIFLELLVPVKSTHWPESTGKGLDSRSGIYNASISTRALCLTGAWALKLWQLIHICSPP